MTEFRRWPMIAMTALTVTWMAMSCQSIATRNDLSDRLILTTKYRPARDFVCNKISEQQSMYVCRELP